MEELKEEGKLEKKLREKEGYLQKIKEKDPKNELGLKKEIEEEIAYMKETLALRKEMAELKKEISYNERKKLDSVKREKESFERSIERISNEISNLHNKIKELEKNKEHCKKQMEEYLLQEPKIEKKINRKFSKEQINEKMARIKEIKRILEPPSHSYPDREYGGFIGFSGSLGGIDQEVAFPEKREIIKLFKFFLS